MNEQDHLPGVDILKDLYYELKDKVQEDVDIINRDITEEFLNYIDDKIKHKELFNCAIRGEPGTGKSVLMLFIKLRANKYISKIFNKKIDEYETIAPDQTDFLRLVKGLTHVCVGIDEYNPMSKGGANASTEESEFQFYTDLCRVFYVHRVWCSPTKIQDPNCPLILDVIAKEEDKQMTTVRILYRNSLEGKIIVLGTARFNVSEILNAPHYKKYEAKKLLRVNLLTQHGIRDRRTLEFAYINSLVVQDLRKIAPLLNQPELRSHIALKSVEYMEELYKRPVSWFAEDELVKPVFSILNGYKTIAKLQERGRKEGKNVQIAVQEIQKTIESQHRRILKKKKLYEDYIKIQ